MHHLSVLDQLVSRAFCFDPYASECLQAKSFCALLDRAVAESGKVKPLMLKQAFENKDAKHMKVFVQTYQAVCIDLCNKVFEGEAAILQLPYNDHSVSGMLQKQGLVLYHLLSLLSFIEKRFNKYFDTAQLMPLRFATIEGDAMQTTAHALRLELNIVFDPAVVEILLEPLIQFAVSQQHAPASYEIYFLTKRYLFCLASVTPLAGKTSAASCLMYRLIEIGYCPQNFLHYYLQLLKSKALEVEDQGLQQQVWKEEIKAIKLVQATGTLGQIIIKALEEEIPAANVLKTVESNHVAHLPKDKVLLTSMSVAQLGLFVRILVETGTIKCSNQTLLLRMIAAAFKTTKTAAISPESLRIKYYATDPASVSIVKDYMKLLMNQLMRY